MSFISIYFTFLFWMWISLSRRQKDWWWYLLQEVTETWTVHDFLQCLYSEELMLILLVSELLYKLQSSRAAKNLAASQCCQTFRPIRGSRLATCDSFNRPQSVFQDISRVVRNKKWSSNSRVWRVLNECWQNILSLSTIHLILQRTESLAHWIWKAWQVYCTFQHQVCEDIRNGTVKATVQWRRLLIKKF